MNIQPDVCFFENSENAFMYREQNRGWLYQVQSGLGYFWFPSTVRPIEILQHPVLNGALGRLLIGREGEKSCR